MDLMKGWENKGSQTHDISGNHNPSSQTTTANPDGFADFASCGFCSSVFWMGEQCHVVWKNTDAHRPNGRILLLGEGQADKMPPMRKKPWISASWSVVFKDKRRASSAKGTAARHPLLPVLQGGFWWGDAWIIFCYWGRG